MSDDIITLTVIQQRSADRYGWRSTRGIGPSTIRTLAAKELIEVLQTTSGAMQVRLTPAGAKRLQAAA